MAKDDVGCSRGKSVVEEDIYFNEDTETINLVNDVGINHLEYVDIDNFDPFDGLDVDERGRDGYVRQEVVEDDILVGDAIDEEDVVGNNSKFLV